MKSYILTTYVVSHGQHSFEFFTLAVVGNTHEGGVGDNAKRDEHIGEGVHDEQLYVIGESAGW